MAQNIVQSLFGFTPEFAQQQMYQTGENRAMQLAQMSRSPTAAAEFYGLRSAERFGAAPIFGPSQQVQKASDIQSIIQSVQASGVDLSQPEGLIELANAVGQNPEFGGIATSLRQEAAKMTQAQTKFAYDIGAKGAQIQKDIAAAGREKEPTKVGVSEEGQNVFLKNGRQFTIDSAGNYIPFSGKIREGAGTNVTLSVPQEAALIEKGLSATSAITKRMTAINTALNLNSQNSPYAGEAFKQEAGTIFGDNVKAAAEIKALANTGALDTRIANRIVSFFEGKVTQTTKEDRDAVLKAIQNQSEDEYERTIRPFRAAVNNEQQAMRLFPSFKERYSLSKGIIKQGRPIPAGQESKYTEGSKWEKGNKKYVVRGGQLIEE